MTAYRQSGFAARISSTRISSTSPRMAITTQSVLIGDRSTTMSLQTDSGLFESRPTYEFMVPYRLSTTTSSRQVLERLQRQLSMPMETQQQQTGLVSWLFHPTDTC